MPIYTVHEPPATRNPRRRGPERFVFVRDGFYVWAFLLTPLWLLWRRLWLVLLGWIVVSVALAAGMTFAGVAQPAQFIAQALLALLVGLEAGSLQRWTLRRRKWRELGTVSADSLEAAERRFFDGWIGEAPVHAGVVAPTLYGQPTPPGYVPSVPPRRPGGPEVIGLFPEPGAGR